jgi:hypothetical protein
MQSIGTGRKLFTITVDFFPIWEINPLSAYKQLSSSSSRTGKKCQAVSKIFIYIRVANLGYFSSKKQIWGYFQNVQGIFRQISGHLKC